jgi:hypothetical protein
VALSLALLCPTDDDSPFSGKGMRAISRSECYHTLDLHSSNDNMFSAFIHSKDRDG